MDRHADSESGTDSGNATNRRSVPIDLNRLVIPNPCMVGWDTMSGDDRIRHCGQCDRNVYNLSELTGAEAIAIIESAEQVCMHLHRRVDGTVVTKDCPPLVASRHRRGFQFSTRALLFLAAATAGLCAIVPIVGPKIVGAAERWMTPPPVANPVRNPEEFWDGMVMEDRDF